MAVIGRECEAFMKTLPIGQPIDLKACRLEDVILRVVIHVVYGEEVLEKYFDRIVELGRLLEEAVDLINVGATRLPLYSSLPTATNIKVNSFNKGWTEFNRSLFDLFEKGNINAGDGLFFETMELLKTHVLDIDEEEVGTP